ncbi:ABC transporter permease [Deinococcus sp. KNUC1210]|uniref:ABC transporter permease n=1 Tax=Deinococcus sp. KNUC1210 TaxID=2917691 RepID=UPI001EF12551|nr:ABC transporter permease [Deinococcus sp. KNUC1210]ULH14866.1 ABC transporter permease [Deinococcus sp. KNUC1210]
MIRLVQLASPGRYRPLWVSLGALVVALLIAGIIFATYGVSPLEAYGSMLQGTLLDPQGRAEVLRRAAPLLLTGAGLTLAFRAQFFNIGAEGQIVIGAIFAGGVALFTPLPGLLMPIGMFVAGFVGGGLYALLAAWLRTRLRVNEILSTLMLNYVATYLMIYLIAGPWKGKNVRGFITSDTFPAQGQLATFPGTQVGIATVVLGVVLAVGLQILLSRTTRGFELRVVGENPGAARYAGISVARVVTFMALITGGMAGLAGAGEVAGIHHKLLEPGQISAGYGFTAIIVAWLARGNPALCLVTSLLMGVILAGGDVLKINLNMPFRIVDVFSGVMLLTLIASEIFVRYRVKWGR